MGSPYPDASATPVASFTAGASSPVAPSGSSTASASGSSSSASGGSSQSSGNGAVRQTMSAFVVLCAVSAGMLLL